MEPPSTVSIQVQNGTRFILETEAIARVARVTANSHRVIGDISIVLMSNEEIANLNRIFRREDFATDVLTFLIPPVSFDQPSTGDIAISVDYAAEQASLRGVELTVELQNLAIHGVLHLAGFDDVSEQDREAMQAEMARMGELCGLPADPEWSSVLHHHTHPQVLI